MELPRLSNLGLRYLVLRFLLVLRYDLRCFILSAMSFLISISDIYTTSPLSRHTAVPMVPLPVSTPSVRFCVYFVVSYISLIVNGVFRFTLAFCCFKSSLAITLLHGINGLPSFAITYTINKFLLINTLPYGRFVRISCTVTIQAFRHQLDNNRKVFYTYTTSGFVCSNPTLNVCDRAGICCVNPRCHNLTIVVSVSGILSLVNF